MLLGVAYMKLTPLVTPRRKHSFIHSFRIRFNGISSCSTKASDQQRFSSLPSPHSVCMPGPCRGVDEPASGWLVLLWHEAICDRSSCPDRLLDGPYQACLICLQAPRTGTSLQARRRSVRAKCLPPQRQVKAPRH